LTHLLLLPIALSLFHTLAVCLSLCECVCICMCVCVYLCPEALFLFICVIYFLALLSLLAAPDANVVVVAVAVVAVGVAVVCICDKNKCAGINLPSAICQWPVCPFLLTSSTLSIQHFPLSILDSTLLSLAAIRKFKRNANV